MSGGFSVVLTKRAAKELKKLDRPVQQMIGAWIRKNLRDTP